MVYVRQEFLPNLKEYKYASVDHSLTSKYILKPFYTNVVIKLFPMSMAPNLITLSGFSFIIANILTLLWYNPTLDQDCPSWVYYSWAAGLFLYQTFDAVDGSQARRTRQSGPLGELFDHGVDALNTSLGALIFAGSQNLGQGWRTVAVLAAALLTFYVQTWDEYHTKQLTLGVVNGPVEGVLMMVFIYTVTGYKGGASFWSQSMLPTLGVPALPFCAQVHLQRVLHRVVPHPGRRRARAQHAPSRRATSSSRGARGGRAAPPRLALLRGRELLGSYSTAPDDPAQHLVPFTVFAGIVNAYSVGQMITAPPPSSCRSPYWNVLVIPVAFGVIDSLGPQLLASAALWLALGPRRRRLPGLVHVPHARHGRRRLRQLCRRRHRHHLRLPRHLVPHHQAPVRGGRGREDGEAELGAGLRW
ncbi:choline/ethanolaminephosphotransferase [Verticillium alfalfae VaMs.102]|uniref:diacylglycerol cholinephosphotransferase n=1 Tax=Verticillium alfalfae (strain VaMs.102 / ATCC MYA-4576 / FGSC 10136) TaxID=526221 RepID=C9S9C7_VERA1|nr:choline/ethanolaminephosphotransferase [Verticillium alfalfae VaMs.102]EEY15990.1 choline/ethanolaminephosphotransferase [Verticillium alfalfae VaMs.102]